MNRSDYQWCLKQIGKRERRCTGRYMYMRKGVDGNVEFFWGKESPQVYATLTPDNLLTIDHKSTTSGWLQNHIWKIFDIRISSEAATHRNHKYRMRLHDGQSYYSRGMDLPWINGTQFRNGKLIEGEMERLVALDVVRCTDRTKAKAVRATMNEIKAVLFTLVRLGVQPVGLSMETLSSLKIDNGYYYDADKVLDYVRSDVDPAHKMAVLSKLARPWWRYHSIDSFKLGWSKLEKALLEKEGAYYYEPVGLTQGDN